MTPVYKKAKRFTNWLDRFMRDWEGEEEAPGRDRIPGVMERLNRLDGELSSNGGRSIKDIVFKMSDTQEIMLEAFVEMGERLIAIETHLTKSEVNTQNSDA